MKVELKIHNGSTKASRLTLVDICKKGTGMMNCVSHTSMTMNDIGIDIK